MDTPIGERLTSLLRRRYGKLQDAAKILEYSERQLSRWAAGDTPKIIENLEREGIIHITGECSCSRAEPEQATA